MSALSLKCPLARPPRATRFRRNAWHGTLHLWRQGRASVQCGCIASSLVAPSFRRLVLVDTTENARWKEGALKWKSGRSFTATSLLCMRQPRLSAPARCSLARWQPVSTARRECLHCLPSTLDAMTTILMALLLCRTPPQTVGPGVSSSQCDALNTSQRLVFIYIKYRSPSGGRERR